MINGTTPEVLQGIEHLHVDVQDVEEAQILLHFSEGVAFIEAAVNSRGRVLVHCAAGRSRSSSVQHLLGISFMDITLCFTLEKLSYTI